MESSDDVGNDVFHSECQQNIVKNEKNVQQMTNQQTRAAKVPRRVLHFSDGVLEEYSTDEEEEVDKAKETKTVDTKRLTWPQYFLYATMAFGNGTLKACDYVGEGLANFFGITTPKYQYEINEYERMMKEQEEAKKKEDVEMRGWHENNQNGDAPVVSSGPAPAVATITETQERY